MEHFAAFLNKPVKASHLYDRFMEVLAPITFRERAAQRHEARDQLDGTMGKRYPLRILLAEDNAINQKVALTVMDRLGYHADVVGNGAQALAAVQRQPYDVVLMDVQMPEMDGLEATRRIRITLPPTAQPRIVAMTANAMQGDREVCLEAGMDDYVSKPFQIEELVKALSKCRPLRVGPLGVSPVDMDLVNDEKADVDKAEKGNGTDPEHDRASLPVFDPAGLQQLKEILGQKADDLLPTLIDNFFVDAPKLITTSRQAVEQGQAIALRRAAHTLKSNSRDFGAVALAEVARELESRSKEGLPDGAVELIDRMDVEFARAKTALEQVRERMTDGDS